MTCFYGFCWLRDQTQTTDVSCRKIHCGPERDHLIIVIFSNNEFAYLCNERAFITPNMCPIRT